MFKMNNFTEKLFFILTWLAQGPSFLEPAAYALMHRKHHRLSDTEGDPHSPVKFSNWFKFMLKTFDEYRSFKNEVAKNNYEDKNLPRWPKFESIVDTYTVRTLFALSYVLFYVYFAPNILFFLLVPIHIAMGPIHGFIVNWFGHKHGYRNFKMLGDNSKNTLHIDFLMMGELYQNNHHRYPQKMNFAVKWFEVDFGFYIVKILHFLRIITIK